MTRQFRVVDPGERQMVGSFKIGQTHDLLVPISQGDLARYIEISGDSAPLHTDDIFAKAAGFRGALVHGAYLQALVSRLVGMHFPGPNAVLQRMDMAFRNPCYAPCEVMLAATVRQISDAISTVILDITISDNQGSVLASGKTWHKILNIN